MIRNGVPESMLSCAQELGRAGRDGFQATARILYKQSDISHANAWGAKIFQEEMRSLSNFRCLGVL